MSFRSLFEIALSNVPLHCQHSLLEFEVEFSLIGLGLPSLRFGVKEPVPIDRVSVFLGADSDTAAFIAVRDTALANHLLAHWSACARRRLRRVQPWIMEDPSGEGAPAPGAGVEHQEPQNAGEDTALHGAGVEAKATALEVHERWDHCAEDAREDNGD